MAKEGSVPSGQVPNRHSRLAASSLAVGGIAYFLFQWPATWLTPPWYPGVLGEVWMAGLALHGATLVLLAFGLFHAGRRLEPGSPTTGVWWLGYVFALLGLVGGHPFWVAAMVCFSIVEVAVHRHRITGAMLTVGSAAWLWVFLAGAHLGDKNSRPPSESESRISLLGLALMSAGLLAAGITGLREERSISSRPPSGYFPAKT